MTAMAFMTSSSVGKSPNLSPNPFWVNTDLSIEKALTSISPSMTRQFGATWQLGTQHLLLLVMNQARRTRIGLSSLAIRSSGRVMILELVVSGSQLRLGIIVILRWKVLRRLGIWFMRIAGYKVLLSDLLMLQLTFGCFLVLSLFQEHYKGNGFFCCLSRYLGVYSIVDFN